MFVRRLSVFLSVCLSVCVRSGTVNQTSLKWELNTNSSKTINKTIKGTDFKYDMFPWTVRHDPLKNFRKGGVARVRVT